MDHREAIQADLLRETGYELSDVGRSLSWDALDSFLRHSRPDSALMRELHPEVSEWATTLKTNEILADLYDLLSVVNANLIAAATHRAARRTKPYPRPGNRENKDERHIGSGALPADELEKWIEERRRRHAGGSEGDTDGDAGP